VETAGIFSVECGSNVLLTYTSTIH